MQMSETRKILRQGFRYLNMFMLLMFRLGLGWMINIWPPVIGRIMVIRHIGRKSGQARYTPVNYAMVDGEIYCTSGFGSGSDWYRNLVKQPDAEIWLPDGWYAVRAEDANADPRRLALMRAVLMGAGFASFAAGIDPYTISDEKLAGVTESYRLVHLQRVAARTGTGGPGEWAWVWPLLTFALLMGRRGKRRCSEKRCCGK